MGVSIHTRHYWRVKLTGDAIRFSSTGFNPHPPLLAGETTWRGKTTARSLFQSTPAITGG